MAVGLLERQPQVGICGLKRHAGQGVLGQAVGIVDRFELELQLRHHVEPRPGVAHRPLFLDGQAVGGDALVLQVAHPVMEAVQPVADQRLVDAGIRRTGVTAQRQDAEGSESGADQQGDEGK